MPINKAEVIENKPYLVNVILASKEISKYLLKYKLLKFHVLECIVILYVDVENPILFTDVIGEEMQLTEQDKFS